MMEYCLRLFSRLTVILISSRALLISPESFVTWCHRWRKGKQLVRCLMMLGKAWDKMEQTVRGGSSSVRVHVCVCTLQTIQTGLFFSNSAPQLELISL